MESNTLSDVNSGSKFETSISDFTTGINGALIPLLSMTYHGTPANHGCSLMSFAPLGPEPSLLSSFFCNSDSKIFLADALIPGGYFNESYLILENNSSLVYLLS
mmetsp:Transcript_32169/g.49859  ORF Transcript_32169/g.49859 Transcript_32169/m.49859 type:complete len:104 (-) Transcript_32169:705-1016(-)